MARPLTIADVHEAMRRGELGCRELVLGCLRRIAAYDRAGPCFQAVISLNPDALARADELDRIGVANDRPLHGIPVLLKDSINTASIPTTGGSLALLGLRPPRDAAIVERLERAGAIIVAKTNLDELGRGGWGASSVGGQTKNAYDPARSPGGSSGGTATGLAADYALIGVGTDALGSIRVPASFNGVVGIRPTVGLVSHDGLIPLSTTCGTAGPMARSVEDAARLLDILADGDRAGGSAPGAPGPAREPYTGFLDAQGVRGRSIGVVRQLFGANADAEPVNDVVERALADFRRLGTRVVDPVGSAEIDRLQLGSFEAWLGAALSTWESRPAFEDYLRSLGDGAPIESFQQLVEIGSVVERVQRDLERSAAAGSLDDPAYRKALDELPPARALALRLMDEHELDALCYPTVQVPPALLGRDQPGVNSVWSSVTGFPAMSIPAGYADGGRFPVGLELLGRPWGEGALIEIAYGFEQAADRWLPTRWAPPLAPAASTRAGR